jgi:small conductance mechanosensitive channel
VFPSDAYELLASGSPSSTPSAHPSSLAQVGQSAGQTAQQAASWLDTHWESWVASTLGGALRIIVIVALALLLRALVHRLIHKLIGRMTKNGDTSGNARLGGLMVNAERRRQRAEAIGSVLRSSASVLILGTAALNVLSVLGIDLAPLLASAGVAGVAIGLGAKSVVTDFLSGVFMILEDQYGVGDEIDAGAASGTVLEVGLRVTKLRGADGEIWYLRNGEISRIGNLSQGWSTATVPVQVDAGEDLDRVIEVIESAAERMAATSPWDEALWEQVNVLGVDEVTADTVLLKVQARAMPGKSGSVARELRARLKRAFDDAGISTGRPRLATVREPARLGPEPSDAEPKAQ